MNPRRTSPANLTYRDTSNPLTAPPAAFTLVFQCWDTASPITAIQNKMVTGRPSLTWSPTDVAASSSRSWNSSQNQILGAGRCRRDCRDPPVPGDSGSSGDSSGSWDVTSRRDGCALGLSYRYTERGIPAARGKLPVVLLLY